MKKKHILRLGLVLGVTGVLTMGLLTGCRMKAVDNSKGHAYIGAAQDTESEIISELYALAMKDGGYAVTRVFDQKSADLPTLLQKGKTNVSMGRTGALLRDTLNVDPIQDEKKSLDEVQTGMMTVMDVTVLDAAPADDRPGLAVTKAAADQYGLKTVSDLQKVSGRLVLARDGFYDSNDFDSAGLSKAYGTFDWKSEKAVHVKASSKTKSGRLKAGSDSLASAAKYKLLKSGEAQVCAARATDGWLTDSGIVFLEDDRDFWPAYQLVSMSRNDFLTHRIQAGRLLNAINAKLTTKELRKLNAQVEVEGKSYTAVAKAYYDSIQDDLPFSDKK